MDIEEITAGRKKAILMDNNILASNYGLQQIEKIIKLGIKVDFNHLITDEIARLLAKVKWINVFALDAIHRDRLQKLNVLPL